jgi:hypothetical protein
MGKPEKYDHQNFPSDLFLVVPTKSVTTTSSLLESPPSIVSQKYNEVMPNKTPICMFYKVVNIQTGSKQSSQS